MIKIVCMLAVVGLFGCQKPDPQPTPEVKPTKTACEELRERITLPNCKTPAVPMPEMEGASSSVMAALANTDSRMAKALEDNCKQSVTQLDKYPECKK